MPGRTLAGAREDGFSGGGTWVERGVWHPGGQFIPIARTFEMLGVSQGLGDLGRCLVTCVRTGWGACLAESESLLLAAPTERPQQGDTCHRPGRPRPMTVSLKFHFIPLFLKSSDVASNSKSTKGCSEKARPPLPRAPRDGDSGCSRGGRGADGDRTPSTAPPPPPTTGCAAQRWGRPFPKVRGTYLVVGSRV